MSNTGTYVWRDGRLVRLSSRTPKLGYITEVSMPRLKGRIHKPFNTEHISGRRVEYSTRKQLYEDMKTHGVRYAEGRPNRPAPDPKKREKQIAEKLSKEAHKRGFKWRV